MLHVLVDDLLVGETRGYAVVDTSRRVGDPRRDFRLRVILLYVCGDWPALGKAAGFSHAGDYECHYCHDISTTVNGRPTHGCFCRWLAQGDVLRKHARLVKLHDKYTLQGNGGKPTARTKFSVRRDAHTRLHGDKTKARGVKFLTPFDLLDRFDVVWDFPVDMMHTVNAFFDHMIPLLKGDRPLAEPTLMQLDKRRADGSRVPFPAEELATRVARNKAKVQDFDAATLVRTFPLLFSCIFHAFFLRCYRPIIINLVRLHSVENTRFCHCQH